MTGDKLDIPTAYQKRTDLCYYCNKRTIVVGLGSPQTCQKCEDEFAARRIFPAHCPSCGYKWHICIAEEACCRCGAEMVKDA